MAVFIIRVLIHHDYNNDYLLHEGYFKTKHYSDQSTLLGKFGFKTVSSGTVEVRVNVVKQTMPSFTEDNQKYKRVALKVCLKYLSVSWNSTCYLQEIYWRIDINS